MGFSSTRPLGARGVAFGLGATLAVAGCAGGTPDERPPPSLVGQRCQPAAIDPCGPGLFCGPRSRCEVVPSIDAGPGDGEVCGVLALELRPLIPTVVFLLDRSGSMRMPFAGEEESRWDVLEQALFGRDFEGRVPGIIRAESNRVRFGLSMYTGSGVACPELAWHRPRLDGTDVLRSAYAAAAPAGSGFTPTGDAVTATVARIRSELPPGTQAFLVLATDGEPDRCEAPGAQDAVSRAAAEDAVARAFDDERIGTFVLSLAELDEGHLQRVANVGVAGSAGLSDGVDPAPFWSPEETEGLREALEEIVDGAFSCRIPLDGVPSPDFACRAGRVILDGRQLVCGDEDDGFLVLPGGVLELTGRACEQYLTGDGGRLDATFPCPPLD